MAEIVQIFLSYARQDREKVDELYQRLSEAGYKPWMDTKDILPGENFRLAIEKAIQSADFFVPCLSGNSVDRRGFIQREMKQAVDLWKEKLNDDIYVIPVRFEECGTPDDIHSFQWLNLFESDGWTRLLRSFEVGMERRRKL
jgi:TIR domain